MRNLILTATFSFLILAGCAPIDSRHGMPNPTAVGAVLGATYGQALGHDTESTLIGAALGGVLGSIWGDHQAYRYQAARDLQQDRVMQRNHVAPQYSTPSNSPGQWVEVPPSYVSNYFVPSHYVFVPVANRSVIVER